MEKTVDLVSVAEKAPRYDEDSFSDEPNARELALQYNQNDHKDMYRMGKTASLRRGFRQISMISLVLVLVNTWSCMLIANTQGLQNGGLGGLFWSYVWTLPGFAAIAASLAEMASFAPTSGGMYHWVSEFAPPPFQKLLSYITGWMAVLSWQAGNASGAFIAGTMIGAVLTVPDPDFVLAPYQSVLFVFAAVLIVWIVNVLFYRWLPMIQDMMLGLFGATFIAFVCVFWTRSPHTNAQNVFLTFKDGGDWSTIGLSLMIGQITAVYGLVGSDTAAHLSEEMRDASLTVSRAIWYSFSINATLGLVMLITFLFTVTDVHAALNDVSGFSYYWVMKQTFPDSPVGIYVLSAALIALCLMSNINFNMTTSRQLWAFARDGGVPFSGYLAHVNGKFVLPIRSISLTCIITCLLALLDLGSGTAIAFNAIISVFLVALMFTYIVSIACFLRFRIKQGEVQARWILGHRTGIATNSFAILYAVFCLFWCFWPPTTATDPADFNWSVVLFCGVLILSLAFYYLGGKSSYTAPVLSVRHVSSTKASLS